MIPVPLLQFDWYRRDIRELFPDRIPPTGESDVVETIRRIVEHENGRARVFLTFWNPAIAAAVELTAHAGMYEAQPLARS